jgi:hypothetical protein
MKIQVMVFSVVTPYSDMIGGPCWYSATSLHGVMTRRLMICLGTFFEKTKKISELSLQKSKVIRTNYLNCFLNNVVYSSLHITKFRGLRYYMSFKMSPTSKFQPHLKVTHSIFIK